MSWSIVIVDDETLLANSLKLFFEDESDFSVEAFASAEEALTYLGNHSADACIVDMRLPGMSGEDFIVNASTLCPECGFIVYTGSVDYVLSPQLKELGIDENLVVFKPVSDMDVFLHLIKEITSRHKAQGQSLSS